MAPIKRKLKRSMEVAEEKEREKNVPMTRSQRKQQTPKQKIVQFNSSKYTSNQSEDDDKSPKKDRKNSFTSKETMHETISSPAEISSSEGPGKQNKRFRELARRAVEHSPEMKSSRKHKNNDINKDSSPFDLNASFSQVAEKVVETQRTARGFKEMWTKVNHETDKYAIINGIHLKDKKLDLNLVAVEFKEEKRTQFYHELFLYGIFLIVLYFLLRLLPIRDSYEQSSVMSDILCTDTISCNIQNVDNVYEFSDHIASQLCRANTNNSRLIRIGGVRLRQVRVKQVDCEIIDSWKVPCYPLYSFENEDRNIMYRKHLNYTWEDHLEVIEPLWQFRIFDRLYFPSRSMETFGSGGYSVDLCTLKNYSTLQLKQDEWIDYGTRSLSLEFTMMNPATSIFTIGSHYFTISPSGHLIHYPRGSNTRLVGDDEDALSMMSPSVLWIIAFLFFCIYISAEFKDMNKTGIMVYFTSDGWNVFEIVQLFLLGSVLYFSMIFVIQSYFIVDHIHQLHIHAKTEIYTEMQQLLITYQRLADYASITSALSLLKIFKFLRMNSTLNLLWQVLGMASKDLISFLFIFSLIFLSYSLMGYVAFGYAVEDFSSIKSSFGCCFRMLAGDFNYDVLQKANPRIAPIFFASFVVLVFQVLVNMFVAILSEYYEVAKSATNGKDEIDYDIINRFRTFLNSFSPTVVLPNNEPLPLERGQLVRLISTNLVDKEITRQRAKKLFRGAVWRVVALLRFGVKFDRKIAFNRRSSQVMDPSKKSMTRFIPLSENFDYKAIKGMIPPGIAIRLEGDSLISNDVLLRVIQHSSLSIECKVMDSITPSSSSSSSSSPSYYSEKEMDSAPLELLGGEVLRIPTRYYLSMLIQTIGKEILNAIYTGLKLSNTSRAELIDDYHLGILFHDARKDKRNTLRYDEVKFLLELFLRTRDKKGNTTYSQSRILKDTSSIMYRFRKSLIDLPSREKEGQNYIPKPMDTSEIELGSLEYISEMLAENCHDIWARERIKQGWKYGRERDCDIKTHPNLVPYYCLPQSEKDFDYRTSMETLKTIIKLNFHITRTSNFPGYLRHSSHSRLSGENRSTLLRQFTSVEDNNNNDEENKNNVWVELENGEIYCPRPIDTSNVEVPLQLSVLVDSLAQNAHDVWALGRMNEGWIYGPTRNDKNKKHPCLVPYVFLTDEEKEYDVNTAMGTLKMLLALGFTFSFKNN